MQRGKTFLMALLFHLKQIFFAVCFLQKVSRGENFHDNFHHNRFGE